MCGICGIVNLNAGLATPAPVPVLQRMLARLRHRGPQGAGIHASGGALFGSQRLAIRALDDGRQPVVEATTGVLAVCNGEIDNHEDVRDWLGRLGRDVGPKADVAVIPALYLEYGDRFAEKLDGAFAIALWDPRCNKLILARDRAGERPLFYSRNDSGILFASEVTSLAAALPEAPVIDHQAIAAYLRTGCFVAPSTPYSGIQKVAPGEIVAFTAGGTSKSRYWRWRGADLPVAPADVNAFDEVFRAAIARLSAVDVDYGLLLSGGLDSSLIAAVLRAVRPGDRPVCYTLRFDDASYDEGDHAARVAAQCGLRMISVPVAPEMFMEELPRLVAMTGEPLSDPAWIPSALAARRAAQDVRIVYGGEGGDELFCGYPTYLGAVLAGYYDKLPVPVRRLARRIAEALPPSERKMPLSYLLKRFVEGDGMDPMERHREWMAQASRRLRSSSGAPHPGGGGGRQGPFNIGLLQLHDFETTLAEGLLTKSDRGGMSAALEIRTPYLDREVMEFAAKLTQHDRLAGLRTKAFLKRYATRYLPRDIVYRRKRGLSIPLVAWLRGPLRDWAQAKLASGRLAEVGVDSDLAVALFREHLAREADHSRTLWTLLVLDDWLAWYQGMNASHAEWSRAA